MDYTLTVDELAFRDEVRTFLEREWGPADPTAGWMTRDPVRDAAFRGVLGNAGYLTMGWGPPHESRPASAIEKFILSQELNRVGAPYVLYILNVIGPLLLKYGSAEAQHELIPRVVSGRTNFVLGYTEPEAGSDLSALKTRAVRDGDVYRVDGQKLYGHALPDDVLVLATRTGEGRDGITLFLMDASSPGVTVTTMPTFSGVTVGATYLDDVEIPATRRLGEEGMGWRYINESLELDRASGIPYNHLVTFIDRLGEAISVIPDAAPGVLDRFAELTIEVEAAEAMQVANACRFAEGTARPLDPSVLKVFCTETERRLMEFAVDVLGANTLVRWQAPGPVEFAFQAGFNLRTNPAATIAGGTSEIQRNLIARHLGLPRG